MTTADSYSLETGSEKLSRRAWGALLVLCGALFLDAMDVSSTGVALPSIRTELDMSTSSLQWVVSAYVLGYGGFLLLGGRAADLLGRRRMFLISLGLVLSGGLTEIGWRWVFFFPGPLALITLLLATRLVPDDGRPPRSAQRFDIAGAVGVTAGMLLLVFTLVEAPEAGEDREDPHPEQEHPASPEQVGGASTEQHEAAVAEHVRAHDPLQLARAHPELGADRGQRDAHHRDVHALHEDGAAEHEQQRESRSGHVFLSRLLLVSNRIMRHHPPGWKKAL